MPPATNEAETMDILLPRDEKDVVAVVEAAVANRVPLEIMGLGSKRGFGAPVTAERHISLSGLSGITLYEPSELVLRAHAGTPMREIRALLDQNGQELAFEPMDYGDLYGAPKDDKAKGGTIGGTIAVNASGPRRIRAGAARDHLLGFKAVSGRAESFKSGGRVMKNVTGYDLSKLLAGSHGTLAIMTEVTVKVLPRPENEESVIATNLTEDQALALLREASGLPYEVSSFACLPEGSVLGLPRGPIAVLRLEGPDLSIQKRKEELITTFRKNTRFAKGQYDILKAAVSREFWAAIRDALPITTCGGQVWRLSTAPSEAAPLVTAIHAAGVPILRWFYDWAGGLIWLCVEATPHAHAPSIRAAVDRFGGHATLIRAEDEVRAAIPVFHPQPPALAALSRRVKHGFDPLSLLNRHRFGTHFDPSVDEPTSLQGAE
ncbi:FAD-binding protein [Beijerinckia indica]|nr:FAD-binding protein [Beijerinckia indica]